MSFAISRRAVTQSALTLLLAPIGFAAFGSAQAATTYFVRTDGGDANQCNGRADAPYSGSGTAQNCAWKHPYYALPNSGTPRIAGGDTLMIGSGEYMIGYGAPGMGGGCASGDKSACSLGKVPSGPSATARTRILGNGAKAPKLWGANGTWSVLNLNSSNNVEIGNLEITDKDACIKGHSVAAAKCATTGNWASVGLAASASSNVWLHDLNIHGLGLHGMNAGGLSNWTMERVKINANGWAGWDANVGTSSSSNSGQMILRQVEIAWNGCGENPTTGEKVNCWGQKAGGYGDGMGTYYTGGQWLIEDSDVHHNTSDGVDLLYLDGAAGTTLTVRRLHAYANAGNQLKTNGNATIENSVIDGYCSYFAGKGYMQAGDQCRANGNALSISMKDGNVVNVRHNTIISEGQGAIMSTGGTSAAKLTLQNNAIVGKPYYLAAVAGTSALSTGHIVYNSTASLTYKGNLFWNVKNGQCPSGSVCQDPKLTNTNLASFDAQPQAGSPLIDKVPVVSGVATDFVLAPRPSGAQADIGAYEVQAGGTTPPPTTPPTDPSPTCTRAAPTLSLSGSTAAVAAGSAVSYTVNVRNNDSAACANTSFSLARTIPAGWTGALSASSVTLAPGASGAATLNVTSPTSAAAGGYGIGTGVSSSVGGTHTASTSTTYTVQSVANAPLTSKAEPGQASYYRGSTVKVSGWVFKDGQPLQGATVKFTAIKPDGVTTIVQTVTTDSYGYAKMTFVSGTGPSSIGTYNVKVVGTANGATTQASTSFKVY